MNSPKTIMIAGGGFGGISAATSVHKLLDDWQIVVIDANNFQCYHPDLYEISSVVSSNQASSLKNLQSLSAIPLNKILKGQNIQLINDRIISIDLNNKLLTTKGSRIEYEYLVIALGSTTHFLGIDGALKYSHPLKTSQDAITIHSDIEKLISRSNDPVSIVISGGGFTGVELAGELMGYIKALTKTYQKPQPNITVIEALPHVLNEMPEWARQTALKRLELLNIKVFLSSKIKKVTESRVICEGEKVFPFDYLIWTTGIKGSQPEKGITGPTITQKDQLQVTAKLNLQGYPEVFAIGDIAEVINKNTQSPVPATAWAAIAEGKVAAKNILNLINNKPLVDYTPQKAAFIVPIGGKFAISNVLGLKIIGILGWVLKRLTSLKYFMSIMPFFEAVKIWERGTVVFASNDQPT